MSKNTNKINIDQLEGLVEAKKRIEYLENIIESLDYHLQQISENEDFKLDDSAGLRVCAKRIDTDTGERKSYIESITIHPSEIPYEKLISKKIKRLRKELEGLKNLFA